MKNNIKLINQALNYCLKLDIKFDSTYGENYPEYRVQFPDTNEVIVCTINGHNEHRKGNIRSVSGLNTCISRYIRDGELQKNGKALIMQMHNRKRLHSIVEMCLKYGINVSLKPNPSSSREMFELHVYDDSISLEYDPNTELSLNKMELTLMKYTSHND